MAVGDLGSGTKLYVGGNFTSAAGVNANYVAAWDGTSWSAVPGTFGPTGNVVINAIAILDPDGPGGAAGTLYAGGTFTSAGGQVASNLARWTGTDWVPAGLTGPVGSVIWDMAVVKITGTPTLFACGLINSIDGVPISNIAQLTQTGWAQVGAGGLNSTTLDLVAWDPDGPGPSNEELYATGHFTTAGGTNAQRVARWDGGQWTALGGGIDSFGRALGVHTAPGVNRLCVGGNFGAAGGVAGTTRVACWDGLAWGPVSGGVLPSVGALGSYDDGQGASLFIGGMDSAIGSGMTFSKIGRWNGAAWSNLGGGVSTISSSFHEFVAHTGPGPLPPGLYGGGHFVRISGQDVFNVARWGCPLTTPCYPNCDGSTTQPVLTPNDFTCFLNSYIAGLPYANCDGSAGSPTLTSNDFTCFLNAYVAGCR